MRVNCEGESMLTEKGILNFEKGSGRSGQRIGSMFKTKNYTADLSVLCKIPTTFLQYNQKMVKM